MRIRLPSGVSFRDDLRLMVWQPHGILDEPQVEKVISALERAEDEAEHPFNRYTDLSKIDAIDLDFGYIFRISLYRRLVYAKRSPVKSAFYVTNKATSHIASTHAMLTNHSPLSVKLFTELEAAAKWLGVAVDDLRIAPAKRPRVSERRSQVPKSRSRIAAGG